MKQQGEDRPILRCRHRRCIPVFQRQFRSLLVDGDYLTIDEYMAKHPNFMHGFMTEERAAPR